MALLNKPDGNEHELSNESEVKWTAPKESLWDRTENAVKYNTPFSKKPTA